MPIRINNFTIQLFPGSHTNQGGLAYIWNMFLDQYGTDINVFVRMIEDMIADLRPDVLVSLVVNCSLVAKVNRILKLKEFWGPHFSFHAARYLLGSFSLKKPLIIGFVAFLQLCRLRLRNRRPSAYFTVEHIQFVEELKLILRETIFEPSVVTWIVSQRQERQGDMFHWEIPDFMNRFGWFLFAQYHNYIGEFDSLPFKFLTAG